MYKYAIIIKLRWRDVNALLLLFLFHLLIFFFFLYIFIYYKVVKQIT